MRASLVETADFVYSVDIRPHGLPEVVGWCLTVTTRWLGARDPSAEQTRLQVCLDESGLRSLATLVRHAVEPHDPKQGAKTVSNPRYCVALELMWRARKAYRDSVQADAPVWLGRFSRDDGNALLHAAARLRWRLPFEWLLDESESALD